MTNRRKPHKIKQVVKPVEPVTLKKQEVTVGRIEPAIQPQLVGDPIDIGKAVKLATYKPPFTKWWVNRHHVSVVPVIKTYGKPGNDGHVFIEVPNSDIDFHTGAVVRLTASKMYVPVRDILSFKEAHSLVEELLKELKQLINAHADEPIPLV